MSLKFGRWVGEEELVSIWHGHHPGPETPLHAFMGLTRGEYAAWVKGEDPPGRPPIVCLCGSTRFREEFLQAQREETLAGRIVLSVGLFGHHEGLDMGGPVKAMLDGLHLEKIRLADEVLVVNKGGYVGESTRREIAFALSLGKPVRYTEPL